MKMKNNSYRGAGFSLVETMIVLAMIALLAALALPQTASAQTNLNVNNTAPYFSTSNSPAINNATVLVNDPVVSTAVSVTGTNNYANAAGTNYAGGLIYPFAVTRSLNVAFGLVITTTNAASKGLYIEQIQGGSGIGDWTTIATLPVSAVPGSVNANLGTTNTYSTNTTVNVGGFDYFRIAQITESGESNYTATATSAFSSKPGL